MLLLSDAFSAIDHALGSAGAAGADIEKTRLRVANDAGILVYSKPWKWLDAGLWNLNVVAGVSYVDLPPDCGTIASVVPADGATAHVRFIDDLDLVQRIRAGREARSESLLAPYQERVDREIVTRLLWSRDPTLTVSGGLTLRGKRRWVTITGSVTGSGEPSIPLPRDLPIFELLYLELARAYARGYEETATTSVGAELAAVWAGPIARDAAEADRARVNRLGPMRNTAIHQAARSRRSVELGWDNPPVVDVQ